MAMSTEMVTALSGLGVSGVTAFGSYWVARAGRRTRQQERRDDFATVTARMDGEILRLERRVKAQEEDAEKQRKRITDQDEALAWLWSWTRSLVVFVRKLGHEPPAAPQPVPEAARRYTRTDV